MADGSLSSLFIDKRSRLPLGVWLDAESHPTPGFAVRPGWHCCPEPRAPHLTERGRVWVEVEIDGVSEERRPASQGGLWYLAQRMIIKEEILG